MFGSPYGLFIRKFLNEYVIINENVDFKVHEIYFTQCKSNSVCKETSGIVRGERSGGWQTAFLILSGEAQCVLALHLPVHKSYRCNCGKRKLDCSLL